MYAELAGLLRLTLKRVGIEEAVLEHGTDRFTSRTVVSQVLGANRRKLEVGKWQHAEGLLELEDKISFLSSDALRRCLPGHDKVLWFFVIKEYEYFIRGS